MDPLVAMFFNIQYTEELLKEMPPNHLLELYYNQYDENRNIPAIDMRKEEQSPGNWVLIFHIYCYDSKTKYLCRVCDCDEHHMKLNL